MPDKCTEVIDHSIIMVEENGKKASFKNSARATFKRTHIDGCLITSGIRADYMITENGVASVIVELKGADVGHACEQVLATAKYPEVAKLMEPRLGFLIICSRYPRFDTFVAKAKQRCAKEHKAGFHIVSHNELFDIRRVVEIDGPR